MLRTMTQDYRQSLDELERAVHVPREQQSETQDIDPPREFVAAEDFERLRLLSNPAGASG